MNKATGNRSIISEGVNPFTSVYRKMTKVAKATEDGEIIKAAIPIVEILIGAQLDAPFALAKIFGGNFDDDNIFDLIGISSSYRPGYGKRTKSKTTTKPRKSGGMSSSDKKAFKKYDPIGYEERYGDRDAERKERDEDRRRDRFQN
jgi:hypothetical protein